MNEIQSAYEGLRDTHVPLISVFGLFCVVTALYIIAYLLSRKGTGPMDQHNTPEQREQRVVADALNDALFELLAEGKISQRKFNHYSSKLGKVLKLPGLLSKSIYPHPENLKQLIRKRLSNGFGSQTLAVLDQKETNLPPPQSIRVTGGKLKISMRKA